MTVQSTRDTAAVPVVRRSLRRATSSVVQCMLLGPRTVASLLRDDPRAVPGRRPAHTLLGLVLGVVGLIVAAMIALLVARGVLYGLVDDGPYDDSWGGPTLAGAWAAHLGVALAAMVPTVALACGVTALHRRATAWLHGGTLPAWFAPVTAVVGLVVAAFLVAFVRQL